MDIRGLDAFGRFARNETTFVFDIPKIGIHEKFTGSTRDESMDEFVDWLKENGKGTLSKLMRGFAEHTPNDPVAGNPHSLMANLVSTDFNRAFSADETSGIPADETTSEKPSSEKTTTTNSNLIALSPRFGSLRQGNLDSTQITLPIAYTIRFNSDPRYQINFSMPITWVEVDGANAYSTGLGVGFTFPVPYIDNWSLTPAVSYGGVGSVDLASLSQVISGSLTSIYTFKIGKYLLKLGNMGGYYRTMPFPYSVSGFDISSFDPGISNEVFRNGVMVGIPTESVLKNTSVELFVNDTRYFGDKLFIDNYQEFGFSYGFNKAYRKNLKDKVKNCLNDLRGGASYLYSNESQGYSFNMGYTF